MEASAPARDGMNLVNPLGVVWDPGYRLWADALEQRVIRHERNPHDGPPSQYVLGSFHTNIPQEPPSGNSHVWASSVLPPWRSL